MLFVKAKNESKSKLPELIENIAKYKSNGNKYYVFDLPKWRYDLLSLNLEGKLIVVSVIVEYIICLFLLKKKNRL